MNSNFKSFFHRLEAAISITILLLACQQFSAIEQHQQNIITYYSIAHKNFVEFSARSIKQN
jgi:hypothetical protein